MKEITLGIKSITVVEQSGKADIVFIHTTLVSGTFLDDHLILKTDCSLGSGKTYVEENFGITPTVIVA